jgi:hypothetical protein
MIGCGPALDYRVLFPTGVRRVQRGCLGGLLDARGFFVPYIDAGAP